MKLAEWILSLGVRSADEREMILGDLLEQAPRRGAAWCARQALAIAIYAAARRVPAFRGRASGGFVMQTWVHDIRYAARALRKRPLVTLTVAVTLAFGLGANAAVFSMVDRLILRPYPLVDADRAVMLAETGPQIQYRRHTVSPGNFVDWRATADTMQHLAAVQWWDANLVERDDPERLAGFKVSAAFFDALGVRPALGRGFVRDDETFGRHHVLVISECSGTAASIAIRRSSAGASSSTASRTRSSASRRRDSAFPTAPRSGRRSRSIRRVRRRARRAT